MVGHDALRSGGQPVSRTELTPVGFLRRSAAVYPDKVAVVHGQRRYSYKQFHQRANRLAGALRAGGLRHLDRVAVLAPNIPAALEAHYGVPAAGGILVPINTRLSPEEIGYILGHAEPRFLLVDAQLEHLIKPDSVHALEPVRIDDTGVPGDPYEDFLATASGADVEPWLEDEEETISINYTSGTTGRPKGAMYSHRSTFLNALGEAVETRLAFDTTYLWTLPMFHCNGWCFTWAVTAVGGRHVCLRGVDPPAVWDALLAEGVTHYAGAPTMHSMVVNHDRARPLPHPVIACMGGSPPPQALVDRLQALNFRPLHLYGMTETNGPHTVCEWGEDWEELSPEARAGRLRRQGHAYVTADLVRVVGEGLDDVPRDGQTMGEVVMRGNNVMKGYYRQPEATAEAFQGGWFHSGDLAVMHPDGAIELRDRKKDIIISGGENISTIEVEQVVCLHPAVLECAVVAQPDDHWGERPRAFVTLAEGATADAAEIIGFCRDRLAHYKCPVAVEFGPLPRTSTGKVQKYVLRARGLPQ